MVRWFWLCSFSVMWVVYLIYLDSVFRFNPFCVLAVSLVLSFGSVVFGFVDRGLFDCGLFILAG